MSRLTWSVLFWSSAALIGYVYVGYPLLLAVWARLARLHAACPGAPDRPLPPVSIILAARNEAERLPARLDNLLASRYPPDRLEIIVASDGSTDATAAALAPYRGRVRWLELPTCGKAGALNAAVACARHPILVFADARQRFHPDAIQWLARHFTDGTTGAVSGELVLDCERAVPAGTGGRSTIGDGVGAYWKYEKWLRRREAIVGSTLGVTGAIYAMRRELWASLPPDTILDDVLTPMRIVLGGHRVVFEHRAIAFDLAAPDAAAELRRKTRTLAGNFQLLWREPGLLVPLRNPVWLQFMSHKVGRLLVPYALLGALAASAMLAPQSTFHRVALALQLAFYGLAAYGAALDRRSRASAVTTGGIYGEVA